MSGEIVTFSDGGTRRQGTVIETFMAGWAGKTGIKRRRERVRIRFTADGHVMQTCRDVEDVAVVAQRSLFDVAV